MRRVRDLALILTLAAWPAAGDMAFVTNQNGDSLSVLDLETRQEVSRIDVPGKPAGVAAHPRLGIYTVSPDSKTVRRFATASREVLAEKVLDGGPTGIAVDAGRGRVFVSDWYNARIWVLDAADLSVIRDLATGAAPAGLDISPDGRWLASADRDADSVSLFDAETLERHADVTVGTRPFGLRFAGDGRLFAANVGSSDVSVVDPVAGEVLATFGVGDRPYGVAFAEGHAFVTNQYAGTVSVVALDTLEEVAVVGVGEYPEGIDVTEDGGTLIVANWFDNSVSLIDATTHEVTGEIAVGDGPRAFGAFVMGGPE